MQPIISHAILLEELGKRQAINSNLSWLYATTNVWISLKAPITVYICAAPANNKRSAEETADCYCLVCLPAWLLQNNHQARNMYALH